MMREDNLLALQPKRFVVTSNSNHKLEVYLNLASRMKLTGINHLWVADITYIRLKGEFVYLAVILDGFSRKVVGWALDRTLATRLTVGALERAIEERHPEPGLVHHSDRGFQYACAEYVAILDKHRVIPSMSRPANPYDSASCESFMKTLKREEIYANKSDDLDHLRAHVEEFIGNQNICIDHHTEGKHYCFDFWERAFFMSLSISREFNALVRFRSDSLPKSLKTSGSGAASLT